MEAKRKCAVCIGCGRCGEYGKDLQVITDSFLKSELLSVDSADKGSFVIADLGTTTIAMEVFDEQGRKLADYVQPNPQRIFGRDVISRIQEAENPLVAKQMQGLVKQVLQQALEEFEKKGADIRKVYVAGNKIASYETWKDKIKISSYGKYILELIKKLLLMGFCILQQKMLQHIE